ncbi:MAG: hypothetical protein AUJ98_08950 [Bacteroidetes bacterium CG2_30_33_31]|nr:MAG: hypothetical protein AUJ98_08950 [Bacteroidetes bacterium CG2_30_33_31]
MKIIQFLFIIVLLSAYYTSDSQTTYNSEKIISKKIFSKNINNIDVDFQISLQNLQSPFEGNSTYSKYLQELKSEIDKKYPVKAMPYSTVRISANIIDTPAVEYSFEANKYNYSVPNDNTLAVSKSGIIVSAINTNIIFYDSKHDSLLKSISLNVFSDTLSVISTQQYDPKVIYDYQKDRFIIVNLAGSSSNNTTHIVVAFQKDADVLGEWSFYALEGNPLNDTSWTDFPAISLSNDELFITGNLLRYGGSWQASFKQSVIWQIDKQAGFDGDNLINTRLYKDIKSNNVNLRNIHPVIGGDSYFGPEMYFMSNKNFAIQSDTFFIIKTSGLLSNSNTKLEIRLLKSDKNYGAPPNPRMPGGKRLATNDARVLGAFYQNNVLQFVGNTIDTATGFATIYHGLIRNPDTANSIKLNLYKSDTLEFGYPNISYIGTNKNSLHSIISFDYTSTIINPGFAAMFFEKEGSYSDLKILKAGETYMNVLMGALQRWGDYSGSQPAYGEAGKVWVCGTYGKINPGQRIYGTWITKLFSNVEDEPVPDHIVKNSIKIFPNPSKDDKINFEFYIPAQLNIDVEIFDLMGRKITIMKNYKASTGLNSLSFSTIPLENGTYFIRIYGDNKQIFSNKFIVLN